MTIKSDTYRGAWRVLPNMGANLKGSIHEDEEARRHGFRRAIVGGTGVAQAIMPAIVELLGPGWIEGGWLTLKFVGPVYPDELVREVAEPAPNDGEFDVRVEYEDGRIAAAGRVGLGEAEPWRDWVIGDRNPDAVFQDLPIGYEFDDISFTFGEDAILRTLDTAGDDTPWFRSASPWGGPVVPPLAAFNPATTPQRDLGLTQPVHGAGMNAEFHLVTRRPMPRDRRYALRMRLIDKGLGGRTWFWTSEFDITDEDGVRYVSARQKCKWFPKEQAG